MTRQAAAARSSEWVYCNRCLWAWDENDPTSEVCACLDKYGHRLVTHIPSGVVEAIKEQGGSELLRAINRA